MKIDREKLIELLEQAEETYYTQTPIGKLISGELTAEYLADYLIEHGVTIPVRCKDCRYSGMYRFGCEETERLACLEIEEDGFIRMACVVTPDYYCGNGEREEE